MVPVLDFSQLKEEEILCLLKKHQINLQPEEILLIQNTLLKRPLTLAECYLWSIQGSEHCSYKSSRVFLKKLPTQGPHVISGAKEDAGIVAVAKDHQGLQYCIALSHESHNHPSQLVPYEGAATGVGGNMRDVSCMGAEVIALADGLRFGSLDNPKTHWIYDGVIAGIGGYGNASGIPNIAGDVFFDEAYTDNCLVTVVTLGVLREDAIIHSYAPKDADNYVYILVGKATDNSGFGGASFASADLTDNLEELNKGAIQEPDAFLKRHLLKANEALFKKLQKQNLIARVGFKDLGAGGVSCAAVELADAGGYGAFIDIDKIPTSMENLPAHVLLCSETQERFMWVVPPELVDLITNHYNDEFELPSISHGAKAVAIGHIRSDKQFVVTSGGQIIVDALASSITRGIVYERPYLKPDTHFKEPQFPESCPNTVLLKLLSHENIASKSPILETYDKQVQGRTKFEAGDADAGLITPFNEEKYPEEIQKTAIALSLDHNPRYSTISPYWGAVNAVIESARNVAAVGAMPLCISDCLCFGNPERPEIMWEFKESIDGIIDACAAIGLKDARNIPLPVIAGNVSFYNETKYNAIHASPMIACLGSMPDVDKAITPHFKKTNSHVLLLGARLDECGGSVYYQLQDILGSYVPKPDLKNIAKEIYGLVDAIDQGLILSAHDISLGGVATALAKMSFKHEIGVMIDIPGTLEPHKKLFSESGGFILEVEAHHLQTLSTLFNTLQLPFWVIGRTQETPRLLLQNCIDLPIATAKTHWENGLREKLL